MTPAVGYTEMKDSGIEWVGEIPKEWRVFPVGGVFSEVKEKNTNNVYQNPFSFRYGEIVDKKIVGDIDENMEETLSAYRVVSPNTIMLNGLNLNYDFVSQRVAIVKEKGIITSAYLAVQPNEKIICPTFILYLLKAYDFRQVFHGIGNGIRKTLKYSDFKGIKVVAPSMEKQRCIAAYLDTQCAKIDEIIAEAKASIEDYKQWKASIIYEAVTKGLDPNVEMKDSGIEWVAKIPARWHKGRVSQVANAYNGDRSSNYPSGGDIVSSGISFLTSNNLGQIKLNTDIQTNKFITSEKYHSLRGAKLQKDDIVFCLRGSVGKCSINKTLTEGSIASSLILIRPVRINPDYLNYVLQNSAITETAVISAIGIGSLNLSAENIMSFSIPLPSLDEQKRIAQYLDETCSYLDDIVLEKQLLIADLEAYKKSLIYEVVTGKRRVRGWV